MVSGQNKDKNKTAKHIDFYTQLDDFFYRNELSLFWFGLALAALLSLFLFDIRISRSGDDVHYIIKGYDLANGFLFPAAKSPLYPFLLSPFIAIFGIRFVLLKFLSLLAVVGQFVFIFKAYRRNIPNAVFYPAFLLATINPYVLYYSSQTYSEAAFMLIQSILIYYFLKNFITQDESQEIKHQYKKVLLLSFIIFLCGMTRSIGYVSLLAILLYFLTQKKWSLTIFVSVCFSIFYGLFEIIKRIVWDFKNLPDNLQIADLLLKDSNFPEKGNENLIGFFQRFFENSQIYLSKYFYVFLGFRPEITSNSVILTIFFCLLFGLAIFWAVRINKTLLFTGIYIGMFYFFTFFFLPIGWESSRMVVTYFPFVMIFVYSGMYYLLTVSNMKKFQFLYLLVVSIVFLACLNRTGDKVVAQIPVLKHNFGGDKFYGYPTELENYLKLAEWTGRNLPQKEVIACNKPNIAQIYGNRKFYGIGQISNENADTILKVLKLNNVKYIITGTLTKENQKKSKIDEEAIHRYLFCIQNKYPNVIRQIQQIGNKEPAFAFEIVYP
jgi:hypothetical protein